MLTHRCKFFYGKPVLPALLYPHCSILPGFCWVALSCLERCHDVAVKLGNQGNLDTLFLSPIDGMAFQWCVGLCLGSSTIQVKRSAFVLCVVVLLCQNHKRLSWAEYFVLFHYDYIEVSEDDVYTLMSN